MSRRLLTAALLAVALAAPGCGGHKAEGGGPEARLRPEDVAVAAVDGVPISASRLAAHARATGLPPRAALDDLVGFELLAQAAARRGLAASPEVAEARARELARRIIQLEFEAHARPEDIPEADLRREYERNRRYFEHPEIRNVVTVLFHAKKGQATPAEDAKAKASAQELAARWRAEHPADANAARAIAETYYGHLPNVRMDQFNFVRGTEGEAEWIKAVMTMHEPGAVSSALRTRYGWHVIYLASFHAATHTPEAEALQTIRREMHPVWQRAAFSRYVDEVAGRHQVEIHPERLQPIAGAEAPAPAPEP
jgi:hypothetical protein